jgi:hypothetical protein
MRKKEGSTGGTHCRISAYRLKGCEANKLRSEESFHKCITWKLTEYVIRALAGDKVMLIRIYTHCTYTDSTQYKGYVILQKVV